MQFLRKICRGNLFWSILILKIVCGTLLGSDFIVRLFTPFVAYFVTHFTNPYDFFLSIGQLKAFPYSTTMLIMISLPMALVNYFIPNYTVVSVAHLFLMRIPLLVADFTIFAILCRWLKTKEDKVIKYYWASPILFYITYFHGQLDAIPIAFLLVALYLLFEDKYRYAAVLFGAALAAKMNILAALPFIAVYIWKQRHSWTPAFKFIGTSLATYFLLILPFVFSKGYQQLVLKASEQGFLFALNISMVDSTIYLAPVALLLLFLKYSSYPKINNDALIMSLGLLFSLLVILVPPRPGWFFWSIPFLAYFFIQKGDLSSIPYLALNLSYLGYFLLAPTSDLFQAFQVIAPTIAALPTPYVMLQNIGLNVTLLNGLLYTALNGSLLMICYWVYKQGVKSNLQYKIKKRATKIGIGGDSGAGKSTMAKLLTDLFGEKHSATVNGDDVHRWERGNKNWKVYTHLNPKSNQLHKDLHQAIALTQGDNIQRVMYDHKTGKFTKPQEMKPTDFIFFVGLHPFYIRKMRQLHDIKIFMDPAETIRLHWKIVRDMKKRKYSKDEVLKQISYRMDDSRKFIQPQKRFADMIVQFHSLNEFDIGNLKSKIDLGLKISLDNSVDLEPLEKALSKHVKAETTFDEYGELQTCALHGKIKAHQLEKIAYTVMPNIDELLKKPTKWHDDYNGMLQLFSLYFLSEISRYKDEP